MLIGEAIQRVKHLYGKGVESSDSRLTNRFVYSILRTVRERILSQELKKKQIISEWSYQTIPCLPTIVAPTHECPCIPWDGCEILRSEFKIPQIITDNDRHVIKSVSKITGTGKNFLDVQFDETTWMHVKYQSGFKFGKTKSQFFIHNGYLYIVHNKTLELVALVAVFTDPLEAYNAASFCDKEIQYKSYLEYDIHIDGKLDKSLIDMAYQEIVYVFSQMQPDDRLNNIDDTGSNIRHPSSYQYRDE